MCILQGSCYFFNSVVGCLVAEEHWLYLKRLYCGIICLYEKFCNGVYYNAHKNTMYTLHNILYNTDPWRRALWLNLTVIQVVRTCPRYMDAGSSTFSLVPLLSQINLLNACVAKRECV
jgi:hypothetical protein